MLWTSWRTKHEFKTTLAHRTEEHDLLLDNDTQDILSRADASTRADILRKWRLSCVLKFDVSVGGTEARQTTSTRSY